MRFRGNVIDAGSQIKIFVAAEKLAKAVRSLASASPPLRMTKYKCSID